MNMLLKYDQEKPFIITDMIATRLTKDDFENKILPYNKELFKGYVWTSKKETDFTWWSKCFKYLTKSKLKEVNGFYCDFYGNITMI